MTEKLDHPIIDKSTWGEGPWQNEPDRLEFESYGLPCLLVRQPHLGHWCGYAAVLPGHKYFKKRYSDIDVNIHGGLTYSEHCQGHVCHVPKPGQPDNVWWLGFDCAHSGDVSPGMRANLKALSQVSPYPFPTSPHWEKYRDIAYVKRQTKYLAKQLATKIPRATTQKP